jgi:hypothetical protein
MHGKHKEDHEMLNSSTDEEEEQEFANNHFKIYN